MPKNYRPSAGRRAKPAMTYGDRFAKHRLFVGSGMADLQARTRSRFAAALWFVLWDYEDSKSGLVRVGIEKLAEKLAADYRNTRRATADLINHGFLRIVDAGKRGRSASVYQLYPIAQPSAAGARKVGPVPGTPDPLVCHKSTGDVSSDPPIHVRSTCQPEREPIPGFAGASPGIASRPPSADPGNRPPESKRTQPADRKRIEAECVRILKAEGIRHDGGRAMYVCDLVRELRAAGVSTLDGRRLDADTLGELDRIDVFEDNLDGGYIERPVAALVK